ncbi:sulfite exporter TauE/SafE family protein [Altererythrobacter sp. KTW20L]|uniref:TSUP family transporter n=1 Tax=Altererythrobacter sp. KTW20L TaxID=2942210 RepID=UPI0024BE53E2|nr:sulfite exporter TauE/SafE family protein [Altererythrobacter sp. KTW20L]
MFVSFLVGRTGVGGGSLMTPILILLFGFNPAVAVGTDLWFAAITKLGATQREGALGAKMRPICRYSIEPPIARCGPQCFTIVV